MFTVDRARAKLGRVYPQPVCRPARLRLESVRTAAPEARRRADQVRLRLGGGHHPRLPGTRPVEPGSAQGGAGDSSYATSPTNAQAGRDRHVAAPPTEESVVTREELLSRLSKRFRRSIYPHLP
jgi:hypothetical protein